MPQRPSNRPASLSSDPVDPSLEKRVREGSDAFAFEALLQGVSAAPPSARSDETDSTVAIPASTRPVPALAAAPDAPAFPRIPEADFPAPRFSLRWEWLGASAILVMLIALLFFYPKEERRKELPDSTSVPVPSMANSAAPSASVGNSPSPPPQTLASSASSAPILPGKPGVFQVRRASGVTGALSYWFVAASGPASDSQPLPAPDLDGLTTLAIPARFNQTGAQLHVLSTQTGQVAQYPLAEWVMPSSPAKSVAAAPNLLKNGDFNTKLQEWELDTRHTQATVKFRSVEPLLASEGVQGHIARISISTSEIPEATANLIYPHLFLREGGTYLLRFWARADTECEIGIATILNTLGGGPSGLDSRLALSVRWQRFELPFSVAIPVTQRQKQPVVFNFVSPTPSQKVFLAGSFNGWNPKANPMTCLSDSRTWHTTLTLEPGVYQYKFVADGNWFPDPHAPEQKDGDGNINSLRTITSDPNRHRLTFLLGSHPGVVHLAGVTLTLKEDTPGNSASEDITILTLKPEDFTEPAGAQKP